MIARVSLFSLPLLALAFSFAACSDDSSPLPTVAAGGAGQSAAAGNAGSPPSGEGGAASSPGAAGAPAGGGAGAGGDVAGGGGNGTEPSCGAAGDQVLLPVNAVATSEVKVLSEEAGVRILYVDASAGGSMKASENPRVYLSLANAALVQVSDKTAKASVEWDLALKRPVLFTNSGDAGSGQGGLVFLPGKAIAEVTAADATGAGFATETFFDEDCEVLVDQMGALATSFDGWYQYDTATNTLAPTVGTYLLRGGNGDLYKVQILSYYATPEGEIGNVSGRYKLAVAKL